MLVARRQAMIDRIAADIRREHGVDARSIAIGRETTLRMLRMNVELPVLLVDHYGAAMVERGRGGILFVNVLNSLAPIAIDSVFQGTKGAVGRPGDISLPTLPRIRTCGTPASGSSDSGIRSRRS